MSNNKQTMKLYTEEQMHTVMLLALGRYEIHSNRKVLKENQDLIDSLTPIELPSDSLCINCDESKSTHNVCMDCIIKIGKENIQLPSDEEIDNYARQSGLVHPFVSMGAKWMRNKILQGGNK